MSFVEIDLFGVYVAPIAPMIVLAYVILFVLRRIAGHFGWFDAIWHPGLFEFALYLIILSSIVLVAASLHAHV
ncbi:MULTISPECIES: DUF1656 domain-containing protein [Lichenihabitans]|uniref:DUF1656 domain-containing protein n=1 Tax=Lichenihabitans TaxID=2723776 RepID=UPI0010366D16|nr:MULTISPECIES: DUF1656 domain-containing protein [Lichenihabitans]UDL95768.1 DUF1656 domain-containing protein [Lichenihabitans sp. PAMC28606]